MEEEIDLRPYVVALIRQWRTIAIIVVAAAIGAAALALALAPSYTASADVLILPSRSQLTFDPRFVTSNTVLGTDVVSRREALIAMASSIALEDQVRPKLPASLSTVAERPGALADSIRVNVNGDLLHFEASAKDPQGAQALADTWARAYVQSVNSLYAADANLLKQLETEVTQAQERYRGSQQEVETFVGTSAIVQISQQISMTVDLLNESRQGSQMLYAQYLTQARDLEAVLRDAETLRQQVASGQTEGLANSLASLAIRARAAGEVQLPIDLRFDNPGSLTDTASVTPADLDALITVLRQRHDVLMEESLKLAQALSDDKSSDGGLSPELRGTYEKRLTALNQQYEQQTAQLKALQQKRDLAFDSLSILQRKLDEQRVALGAPEVQVRFVSTAIEPETSAVSRAAIYAILASVVALLLCIFILLGQMIVRPWLATNPPQPRSERPLDQPTTS